MASPLPSPDELERKIPVPGAIRQLIASNRDTCAQILRGETPRIALIVGPCSIHDGGEALEYARRLQELQPLVEDHFLLVLRAFLEKPRTQLGWKGMLYDPLLDGSEDLAAGLEQSRKLLLALAALVPCATEFLEPLAAPYIGDFICWGLIGARTSASQPHRQLASGLPFPVGFKNATSGDLKHAIHSVATARTSHTHFSIDRLGRLAARRTAGNPLAHLVLRGSDEKPNCDPESVLRSLALLGASHLEERIAIDCSHGNSGKKLPGQRRAFEMCIGQIQGGVWGGVRGSAIRALMLESNLCAGSQPISQPLARGISVTDPCLGWEETRDMVLEAHRRLSGSARSKIDASTSRSLCHLSLSQ